MSCLIRDFFFARQSTLGFYRWFMNKTGIFISVEMKYRWTGVEELTVPLAYLNCQLSFESRVRANDTPTRLETSSLPTRFVVVILLVVVYAVIVGLGRCYADYAFSTT